jgi:PAS domain S-box-containing protein
LKEVVVANGRDRSPGEARLSQRSEVVLFPHQPALQLIYDTAPIGLACLSPDCRYLQINQRLTEICGISVEDHLGRFVRDCVPALADSVEQIVRSIMETGEPVVEVEVAGQRADQVENRSWMTYWHPLRAPSGEIVAINVAAEEITERKRAEQEIRDAKDAAEAALRHLKETQESLIEAEKLAALGRLVAGVAHEINSPVGISLTVTSTLQRKAELFASQVAGGELRRSTLNEFLGTIRDASTQLLANLGRAAELVRLFKQVASDQRGLRRRKFDAGELTTEVLFPLQDELQKRGVTFNVQCGTGLEMMSYPGQLAQVVTNLVVNAMTHAFPDGRPGIVEVQLRSVENDQVEILVRDDGCGMSADVKRHAFDPFFTTGSRKGSTGLGMPIVHNIVTERLGGRIKLQSEPGAGTTVQLVLPRSAGR